MCRDQLTRPCACVPRRSGRLSRCPCMLCVRIGCVISVPCVCARARAASPSRTRWCECDAQIRHQIEALHPFRCAHRYNTKPANHGAKEHYRAGPAPVAYPVVPLPQNRGRCPAGTLPASLQRHKQNLERSVRHTHAATIPTALLHGKRGLGLYSTCACACRGVVCLGMCVCGCYVPAVAMAVVAAVMGVAVALRLAVVDPAPCRRGQQRRQRSP